MVSCTNVEIVLVSKRVSPDLSSSIIDMNSSLLFDDEEVDSILAAQMSEQEEENGTAVSKELLTKLFGRLFQKLQVQVTNFVLAIESVPKPDSHESPSLLFRVPRLTFADNSEYDEDDPSGIQKKLSFNGFSLDLVLHPLRDTVFQKLPREAVQPLIVAENSPKEHEILITIGNAGEKVSTSVQIVCLFQTVKFGISSLQFHSLLSLLNQLQEDDEPPTPPRDCMSSNANSKSSHSQPLTPDDKKFANLARREPVSISSEEIMEMKDSFLRLMMYVIITITY